MVAPDPRMRGSGGTQGTDISNPVDRVNRIYAVYMKADGTEYVAPAGKPKNPQDTMVSTGMMNAEEAEQHIKSRQRTLLAQQAGMNPTATSQEMARRSGSSGQQGVSTVPDIARSENNTAAAVEAAVSGAPNGGPGGDPNQEALDAGPQPLGAGLDDTWLAGRNQDAIQYTMNGTQVVDPRQALNWMLESKGLDTHANRGFLEQAMANYNPLFQIMNPNKPIDPEYALLGAGNFASGLMGMTGNSMNRVDTRGIYDNIWSDEFRNFNSEQVDQTSGGPQAAYQRIVDSINALAPYMGQQNADYLLTKINTAYEDFLNRSTKGDGMQGEQDFLNFIMQFNPQDWY